MTIEGLKRLVREGEGLHLEFKHKAADPQKIMREVVAFSNCKGGVLLIGVDDDGTIRGVKNPQEEIYAMKEALGRFCKPLPTYTFQEIPINSKRSVLIYKIEESDQKPMFVIYNERRKTGRAYFRVADRSVQASRELRLILKQWNRDESIPFTYGDTERWLMDFLRLNQQITLAAFSKEANISQEQASEILIRLTASKVLQIHPGEQIDYYSLMQYES